MPPAATAAPSVLTASPIQAPATSGSCERKVCATKGRIRTSTTAKITTSEDTKTGTTGRARIAPPIAIAAETPQIEMPDGERRRPFAIKAEPFARDVINHRPVDQISLDDGGDAAQHQRTGEAELRLPPSPRISRRE